jgi:threonyl-tRNA synthetase
MKLIPVLNEAHLDYAKQLNERFLDHDFRSELDLRDEKLGYKIRDAQTKKIPYQLVVGDNEVEGDLVTYRKYGSKEQVTVSTDEFIALVHQEIASKGHE